MSREIKYCPGSLKAGYGTYSSAIIRRVFNGHKVSHLLPFPSPEKEGPQQDKFFDNRKRISISGVQEKLSFILDRNKLRLTEAGEQGQYILKPIPRDIFRVSQVPANEHVTMQIAKQVYGIDVAENCLIFFEDGKPAYLVKRFDIKSDGSKYRQEDLASVAQKTKENAGEDFKYEYDYLQLGSVLKKSVTAPEVEMEKFFKLVVFNYLISNGDAHLKNFSLVESDNGDYVLSPAYDLVCTRLHATDSDLALKGGLGEASFDHPSFSTLGYYAYDDFFDFAIMLGIMKSRIHNIMEMMRKDHRETNQLIAHSFLSEETKKLYRKEYKNKLSRLNTSFSKRI
ncbi:MAG: HipA domain-containing protein [bacterium]|nr:HipA domain-containing protein [bacterium]